MTSKQRRQAICELLAQSSAPLSATTLAKQFSVSRQVIVGDIALLRATGEEIIATPRGYVASGAEQGIIHKVACYHAAQDMEEELNIMVDNGCVVIDVIVDHSVYGQLEGQLNLANRHDVLQFVELVKQKGAKPLSDLTDGIHLHTLRCPSQEAWLRVKEQLAQAHFLVEA